MSPLPIQPIHAQSSPPQASPSQHGNGGISDEERARLQQSMDEADKWTAFEQELATEAQDKAERALQRATEDAAAAQEAADAAEQEYLAQTAQAEKEEAREVWNAALRLEKAAWDARAQAFEDVRRLDSSPQVQRLVKEITKSQVRVRTWLTVCVLIFLACVTYVLLNSPSQPVSIETPNPSPSHSVIQTPVPTPPSPSPSGGLAVDPDLVP